jgi:hypothetical protein
MDGWVGGWVVSTCVIADVRYLSGIDRLVSEVLIEDGCGCCVSRGMMSCGAERIVHGCILGASYSTF